MTETLIPICEVLDRIAAGERLTGLTRMRLGGDYLVHHDGGYAWFELDRTGRAARGYRRFFRDEAEAFLREHAEGDAFPDFLLSPWEPPQNPCPLRIRDALSRLEPLLAQLRERPGRCIRVMEDWWLWSSRWFEWVWCTLPDEGDPLVSAPDEVRASSELLSMLLADPDHDFETPPPEVAAVVEDRRARAAELFEAHGPRSGRVMWIGERYNLRIGCTKDPRGFFAEIEVRDDGTTQAVTFYRKCPTAEACHGLFEAFEHGRLTLGSLDVDGELAHLLAGAADLDTIAGWLERREVTVKCGERRVDSWVAESPTTMLDTFDGTVRPVRDVLRRFIEREGWYEVRFRPFIPLPEVARADDDPDAPSVRYSIPKAWAYSFSRDRTIESALVAVLREATGYGGPIERIEKTGESEPYTAPPRMVLLDGGEVAVEVREDPIESGHGVHGERVSVTFRGLPPGLSIRADVGLDMRSGGHVHLDFEGEPTLAMRLKRACLDALP